MPSLEERWLNLCKRSKAIGRPLVYFDQLVTHYKEPHRKHHVLGHLEDMFQEFDEVRHLAEDVNAIEFSIFFHNYVYDVTGKKDSENMSAADFIFVASSVYLGKPLKRKVFEMIPASKHVTIPDDPDTRLFCDLDLTILGQSKERFDQFDRDIREEYGWVGEIAFAKGRIGVLECFLPPNRATIYLTDHFRKKYEKQAIANLERSIAQLQNRLQPL